ncbi:hypothetical protein BT93_L5518 [Corymbia citriodora subsp. variegata]|uniref:protein S-acyltransferase n=1 Tax=Corymbia citriodora subsp. variegata TaxID=360336 RepID=A0A8T0CVQ0_CORYI|nr:hypothetical protein BT93_L5518 [Corymbia citriodora subsp. variegata]
MASSEIEVTESPGAATTQDPPSEAAAAAVVDAFSAAAYGDLEKLRTFVEQGGASLSTPDANGYYPLQWAALNNFADVVQYIIENGGSVNATDNVKQTALHWAAVRGSVAVADVLLQNGAWVEAADTNGYRVLVHSHHFLLRCCYSFSFFSYRS